MCESVGKRIFNSAIETRVPRLAKLVRNMPLVMQLWNIYRSRAIGCWLQRNDVKVIVNIRWGDCRTYRCCCDGVSQNSTIAVGTTAKAHRGEK